jgi:hypothetical protein
MSPSEPKSVFVADINVSIVYYIKMIKAQIRNVIADIEASFTLARCYNPARSTSIFYARDCGNILCSECLNVNNFATILNEQSA